MISIFFKRHGEKVDGLEAEEREHESDDNR